MRILLAALCGFGLALLLGDPEKLAFLHPVVWMGHVIAALEKRLRGRFPGTPRGEFRAGLLLTLIMTLGTLLACSAVLLLLRKICPPAAFLLEVV